jgi:hypothetical protein
MDIVSLKNSVNQKKTKKQEDEKEINFLEKIKEQEQVFEKNDILFEQKKKEIKHTPRVIVLDIDYELQGDKKSCKLTSKVMDSSARQKYDRLLATLSAGLTFNQLPIETQNRYTSLARIMSQCIDAPDWLLEACAEDLEFAYGLTVRLVEHEVKFFRNDSAYGNETERKPRFQIGATALEN